MFSFRACGAKVAFRPLAVRPIAQHEAFSLPLRMSVAKSVSSPPAQRLQHRPRIPPDNHQISPRRCIRFFAALFPLSSAYPLRKSGASASATSAASASSSPIATIACDPSRRMETLAPSASFLPTTSITGTLASECSRTL